MTFDNAELIIIKSKRKTLSVQVKPNQVTVRAPHKMKDKDIASFIELKRTWIEKSIEKISEKQKSLSSIKPLTDEEIRLLKIKAEAEIPFLVEKYSKLIGVKCNNITVRCQRTRWGSCSSKGNLSFNCLLMLLPQEIIESVIVHELCHLKHMNHSSDFYAEIKKHFPDYDRCHKWLNQNGVAVMARIANK